MSAMFEFLDWPVPIPFAHRGGASEAPENTLPAFEYAVGLGYRYVETDVHVTADGVLVAFHDEVLDRVTDRTGVLAELSYSSVREARVDGREPIPLLEDLLGSWPELRVNIDAKADAAVDALAEVVRRSGAVDRVCVGAFSDARVERSRALLGPRLCTSPGPGGVLQLVLGAADTAPAPCVQVPTEFADTPLVTAAFVDRCHGLGMVVHVWTIDDPTEMTRLLDLGVDGIMTDRPAVLRNVLTERQQWVPAP
ncbi:MAG: glycerophosphodiester phosphodiesterase [Acidimicrobiia bacterium]